MTRIVEHPNDAAVRRLLDAAELPTADLTGPHEVEFIAIGSATDPDGVVGLERFESVGLLRSLAVAPSARGRGFGTALVAAVEDAARQSGIARLFLLTTTAEAFFSRLGYTRIAREEAPEPIRATREFSTLCPASAVLMVKALGSD